MGEPDRELVRAAKKRLTNTALTSVAQLVDALDEWSSHWNDDPRPFAWTKPAADIIARVELGRATLAHQIKSAMHY